MRPPALSKPSWEATHLKSHKAATSTGNPGQRTREPALSEVEWGSAVSDRLVIPPKVITITYIQR